MSVGLSTAHNSMDYAVKPLVGGRAYGFPTWYLAWHMVGPLEGGM